MQEPCRADVMIYFVVRESCLHACGDSSLFSLSDDGERTAVYRFAICLSRQHACGAMARLFFSISGRTVVNVVPGSCVGLVGNPCKSA